MIRTTAARHASATATSATSTTSYSTSAMTRASTNLRVRRRPGTRAQVLLRSSAKTIVGSEHQGPLFMRGYAAVTPGSTMRQQNSTPNNIHIQHQQGFSISSVAAKQPEKISKKAQIAQKKKIDNSFKANAQDTFTSRPLDPTSGSRIAAMMSDNPLEDEVIYRKDPSGKIVPVALKDSNVESPVSGLFSQFEDFTTKPSSAPEDIAPRPDSVQEFDISRLTLAEHWIKSKKLDISIDGIKQLIQPLLDVMTLPEQDPKRLQVEREFQKAVKKKNLLIYDLGTNSLQYTRDGAPLAFMLFKMSMDQGDIYARYSYAVMTYRGAKGIPADKYKGREYLLSLAEPGGGRGKVLGLKGLPWAQSTLASIYAREDQDFERARDLYNRAALQGVVEAKVALARMYLNGELKQDLKEAKRYLSSAAQTDDNREAHFLMGSIEMTEARNMAAAFKDADSTSSTTTAAADSDVVHKKSQQLTKSAFQHYLKAASKGMVEAQYNVGQAYFTGFGGVVPKNEALAVEYWKMAGQQGFGLAQLSLGAYYFQDEKPRTQDAQPGSSSSRDADLLENKETASQENKTIVQHVWDPSKKDLMQAQKWFTLASRRPGALGAEGQRLKAQVDEAIRKGGGASRKNGRLGGLTLAQGLKKAGIPFRVFERDESPDFRAQGYRVRINPQGGIALKGTLTKEHFQLFEQTCAEMRHGMTGMNALDATVTRSGADPASRMNRPGGPPMGLPKPGDGPMLGPYTADRKTFRHTLLLGLEAHVEFGKTFQQFKIVGEGSEEEQKVIAYFKDGTQATGSLLVGADGIGSLVRRQALSVLDLVDTTGRVIYGKTPITPELTSIFPSEAMQHITAIKDTRPVTLFLEPVRWTTNVEQESNGRLTNTPDYVYWVLAARKEIFGVESDEDLYKMTHEDSKAHSLKLTQDWDPKVRKLFELQAPYQASVLKLMATGPEMKAWETNAKVTFLGDAIHPMPPTGGSGANTAIRDAALLCDAIQKGITKEHIAEYEAEMRVYASEAISGSWSGGKSLFNLPSYEDCKKL
ncbi:hypothetical protein BGZ83_003752 [Gryganskiella cystojenkinii]|nr:hypothetical protein BGZ83_003752 [Gryganskiella cystojenkinii]